MNNYGICHINYSICHLNDKCIIGKSEYGKKWKPDIFKQESVGKNLKS